MTVHLDQASAEDLHARVMRATGVAPAPLRDRGALESALARPRQAENYEDADVIRQAALLAVGVSQAQAFIDGNKRTAFALCDVFLRLNNLYFGGEPVELAKQLERVAERTDSIGAATDRFEAWLRSTVLPFDE